MRWLRIRQLEAEGVWDWDWAKWRLIFKIDVAVFVFFLTMIVALPGGAPMDAIRALIGLTLFNVVSGSTAGST